MDELIAAAEANRRFSELLRNVRRGRTYTITSHGKAVARVVPAQDADVAGERAKRLLLARLRSQKATGRRRWTRKELYEDDA